MIPVEQVVDVNSPMIIWYRIPGFPGYEISTPMNYIRSFKSRKKYPYGTLVKWTKDGTVTLTNNNNQRVKLRYEDIMKLVQNTKELPVATSDIQVKARNPMCTIDTNAIPEVGKVVAKPKIQISEEYHFVNFDNIPDIIIE